MLNNNYYVVLVEFFSLCVLTYFVFFCKKNKIFFAAAGMKRTFQECASKVGPNGLFIFHFSGHCIKVGADEWGLAPVDFDYSRSTYLTASVLIS